MAFPHQGQNAAAQSGRPVRSGERSKEVEDLVNRFRILGWKGGADSAGQGNQVDIFGVDSRTLKDSLDRLYGDAGMVLGVDPSFLDADQQRLSVAHEANASVVPIIDSKRYHSYRFL